MEVRLQVCHSVCVVSITTVSVSALINYGDTVNCKSVDYKLAQPWIRGHHPGTNYTSAYSQPTYNLMLPLIYHGSIVMHMLAQLILTGCFETGI